MSDTSFPDGELDVVYRLQKFEQNERCLYCSLQLDWNFQLLIFSNRDLKNVLKVAVQTLNQRMFKSLFDDISAKEHKHF